MLVGFKFLCISFSFLLFYFCFPTLTKFDWSLKLFFIAIVRYVSSSIMFFMQNQDSGIQELNFRDNTYFCQVILVWVVLPYLRSSQHPTLCVIRHKSRELKPPSIAKTPRVFIHRLFPNWSCEDDIIESIDNCFEAS